MFDELSSLKKGVPTGLASKERIDGGLPWRIRLIQLVQ
jgi:hypothetical protein